MTNKQKKLSSFFTTRTTSTSPATNANATKKKLSTSTSSSETKTKTKRQIWSISSSSSNFHFNNNDNRSSKDDNISRFQQCIICNRSFPRHQLIQHASDCNGQAGRRGVVVKGDDDTYNNSMNTIAKKPCHNLSSSQTIHQKKTFKNNGGNDGDNDGDGDGDGGRFSKCPICNRSIPTYDLNRHAQSCNGKIMTHTTTSSPSLPDPSSSTRCSSTTTTAVDKKGMENHTSSKDDHNGNGDNNNDNDGNAPQKWREILNNVKTNDKQPNLTRLDDNHDGSGDDNGDDDNDDDNDDDGSLKPTSEPLPGLFLFEDFITDEEECSIIQFLDSSSTSTSSSTTSSSSMPSTSPLTPLSHTTWKYGTFNGRHFGQRWGVHCNLRDRRVYKEETPLPSFIINIILPKLQQLNYKIMKGCIPNEANAIDYEKKKGHYLKNHVDDRQLSKEVIANLSLSGDCFMTFRYEKSTRKKKAKQQCNYHRNGPSLLPDEQKVLLKRRTLQILTGCARYDYSHGITNEDLLSDRRISLTMRQSPLTTKK